MSPFEVTLPSAGWLGVGYSLDLSIKQMGNNYENNGVL
jgi:hypothetical protein